MPLNLNQSNVTLEDPKFTPMLKALQANIIKGHGRDFAYHLFYVFEAQKAAAAKTWLKNYARSLTTAESQLKTTAQFNKGLITDGGPIITLSLSSTGFDHLEIANLKPTASASFLSGMKADARQLGDTPGDWDKGFIGDVDMMILVADDHRQKAEEIADQITKSISPFAKLLEKQKGNILKMAGSQIGIEHFGYADGISQPIYLENEINAQQSHIQWKDQANLDLLLTPESEEEDNFGSFFVYRKLEQNIKAFKDAEGDNPASVGVLPKVKDADGDQNDDLPGAMLVGRFENSVPVVINSTGTLPNPPMVTNDFDYSDDLLALKCPFHSHIRIMNPRNGDTDAGDVSAIRITRRGIPYDDAGRFDEKDIAKITEEILDDVEKQFDKNVGLLFMCYQSNIDSHFKILQEFWANQGQIGPHSLNAQDSIIGQGNNPPKTFPETWNKAPQGGAFTFPKCVTNRGGEYFYTPSINFLLSI